MSIPFWRYLYIEYFKWGDLHRHYLEGPAPLVWLAAFLFVATDNGHCTVARWTHIRPDGFRSRHEVVYRGTDEVVEVHHRERAA